MKKLFALLLAVVMVWMAVSALAEIEMIGDTRLSLDLGDLMIYELYEDEIDDDAVLCFGTEDERMVCVVYEYDDEGLTLQDIEESMREEEDVTASGYTTINGIECFCIVGTDETGDYVIYFTILDEEIVQFAFSYEEDTAELTGVVMNTLQLN